jgi:hypothetical protein
LDPARSDREPEAQKSASILRIVLDLFHARLGLEGPSGLHRRRLLRGAQEACSKAIRAQSARRGNPTGVRGTCSSEGAAGASHPGPDRKGRGGRRLFSAERERQTTAGARNSGARSRQPVGGHRLPGASGPGKEGELFGHVKGAFTVGAAHRKTGRIEAAIAASRGICLESGGLSLLRKLARCGVEWAAPVSFARGAASKS